MLQSVGLQRVRHDLGINNSCSHELPWDSVAYVEGGWQVVEEPVSMEGPDFSQGLVGWTVTHPFNNHLIEQLMCDKMVITVKEKHNEWSVWRRAVLELEFYKVSLRRRHWISDFQFLQDARSLLSSGPLYGLECFFSKYLQGLRPSSVCRFQLSGLS